MVENSDDQSRFKAFRKQLADKKNLERIIGATAAILVTNIAKYLLSIDLVSRWFFNLFGVSPSTYFYNNLRYFVIAILLVGYALVLYLLCKKYIAPMPAKRRKVFGSVVLIAIGGLFALNVYALPLRPGANVLIPTKEWSQRIAESQAPNGGIFAKVGDASFPTQVWTTAQALTGMLANQKDLDDKKIAVIKSAFAYIEKGRHPAPTKPDDYDEGWGLFEGHKKSMTEIAGWVTVAYVGSLESKNQIWDSNQRSAIRERIKRDLALIVQRQSNDGGWRPIKEDGPKFTRTYSTAIALWSLIEARRSDFVREAIGNNYDSHIGNGINWLLKNYTTTTRDGRDEDIGWVPNPNRGGQRERFDGLTAQVLFILSRIEDQPGFERLKQNQELLKYKKAFINKPDLAKRFVCSNDRIHDFDLSFNTDKGGVDFVLEGSTLLWFPWSYAALTALSNDSALTAQEKAQASALRKTILDSKVDDITKFVDEEFMYVLAENLYCFSVSQ
ncbi:MAG TPA: hypothetical protein VMZ30_11645 [Pyrinomonadaceae bacterium]|nr:hypothetical protein [Pyrinomonadaceae bacterium]